MNASEMRRGKERANLNFCQKTKNIKLIKFKIEAMMVKKEETLDAFNTFLWIHYFAKAYAKSLSDHYDFSAGNFSPIHKNI